MCVFLLCSYVTIQSHSWFESPKPAEENYTTQVLLNGKIKSRHKHSRTVLCYAERNMGLNGNAAFSQTPAVGMMGPEDRLNLTLYKVTTLMQIRQMEMNGVFIYLVNYLLTLKLIFLFN